MYVYNFLSVYFSLNRLVCASNTDSESQYSASSPLNLLWPCRNKNCFVLVQTFKTIDISEQVVPIIFRFVQPTITNSTRKIPYWLPNDLSPVVSTNKSQRVLPCELSKYLSEATLKLQIVMRQTSFGYCTGIRLGLLVSASKPWLARVHVDIGLPPSITVEGWTRLSYPHIFQYDLGWITVTLKQPLNPTTIILINTGKYERHHILKWMLESSGIKKKLELPRTVPSNILVADVDHEYKATGLYILKPSNIFAGYTELDLEWSVWINHDMYKEVQLVNPQNKNTEVYISNTVYGITSKSVQGILIGLQGCANLYTHSVKNIAKPTIGIPDPEDRLNEAYGHMIISIMKNISYFSSKTSLCRNGREYSGRDELYYKDRMGVDLHLRKYIQTELPLEPQLIFNHSMSNLRFVICHEKGVDSLPFNSFFSVFEKHVRIWIVIGSGITIIGMNTCKGFSVGCLGASSSRVFSIFKVFVEQSNPFSRKDAKCTSLKLISAGFLLTGVVLSNAYKNTNVYKMIVDRERLRYETYSDLESANVSVYTRIVYVEYEVIIEEVAKLQECDKSIPYSMNEAIHTMDQAGDLYNARHSVRPRYRNGSFTVDYVTEVSTLKYEEGNAYLTKMIKKLYNVTDYYPNTKNVVATPFVKLVRGEVNLSNNTQKLGERLGKVFYQEQNNMIFSLLAKCEKDSFLLPETLAKQMQVNLWKNEALHADISKELYSKTIFGVTFIGLVNIPLLERVPKLFESGIPNWWTGYLGSTKLSLSDFNRQEVKAASIFGNVSIIFLLWLTGILGSILFFGYEFVGSNWTNLLQIVGRRLTKIDLVSTFKRSGQ